MTNKAKKSRKKERLIDQAGHEPDSLIALARKFLEHRRIRNYSEMTTRTQGSHLEHFLRWCHKRGMCKPVEIGIDAVERYQKYLSNYRRSDGIKLSPRSQRDKLDSLRMLFRWLVKQRYAIYNPTVDIILPVRGRRLPEQVLTMKEVERILNVINLADVFGIRDRAILETFYSTGIRRKELVDLRVFDVNMERGIVMIRSGKGRKDRVVPIGERALLWLKKYIGDVRPLLEKAVNETDILFLSRMGKGFSLDGMTGIGRKYIRKAGISKQGACHIFRHTAATLMLENGADLRYIQELLGHTDISTTEVYTRVSVRKLVEVHERTHPSTTFGLENHNSNQSQVSKNGAGHPANEAADVEQTKRS